MTTEKIENAVNEEIHANVETVAASAAAQVDEANRNAEALARAAIQSDHVARLNAIEEGNATWRAQMEQKLAEAKAEAAAAVEASQVSILARLTPPQPEPIPVPLAPEPVNPSELTPEEKGEKKPPPSSPNESQKRRRVLL